MVLCIPGPCSVVTSESSTAKTRDSASWIKPQQCQVWCPCRYPSLRAYACDVAYATGVSVGPPAVARVQPLSVTTPRQRFRQSWRLSTPSLRWQSPVGCSSCCPFEPSRSTVKYVLIRRVTECECPSLFSLLSAALVCIFSLSVPLSPSRPLALIAHTHSLSVSLRLL